MCGNFQGTWYCSFDCPYYLKKKPLFISTEHLFRAALHTKCEKQWMYSQNITILRLSILYIYTTKTAQQCGRCDHSWRCLPQPGTKRRREGILRMEDAGTSEEDDDIDSQDSNTVINHGHLARDCLIKITMPAVKASVISSLGHSLSNDNTIVNQRS